MSPRSFLSNQWNRLALLSFAASVVGAVGVAVSGPGWLAMALLGAAFSLVISATRERHYGELRSLLNRSMAHNRELLSRPGGEDVVRFSLLGLADAASGKRHRYRLVLGRLGDEPRQGRTRARIRAYDSSYAFAIHTGIWRPPSN